MKKAKKFNSCLYDVNIMHHRLLPQEYRFRHRIFMWYLDLNELKSLASHIHLFSVNQPNVFRYDERDHFQLRTATFIESLEQYCRDQNFDKPVKSWRMLTNVRVFGYIFNPVSFIYGFDENDQPVCLVVEIGNTFKELKPFFFGPDCFTKYKYRGQRQKNFYISPFISAQQQMDFSVNIPSSHLNIRINDYEANKPFFLTSMTGHKVDLTNTSLAKFAFKYPFVTFKVISLIHWHAVRLWLKKVPFYSKQAESDAQKDVFRPWKGTASHYHKTK